LIILPALEAEAGGINLLIPFAVVKSRTSNKPAEECFGKDDDAESLFEGDLSENAYIYELELVIAEEVDFKGLLTVYAKLAHEGAGYFSGTS
jgi:hypothetical protein